MQPTHPGLDSVQMILQASGRPPTEGAIVARRPVTRAFEHGALDLVVRSDADEGSPVRCRQTGSRSAGKKSYIRGRQRATIGWFRD